MTILLLSSAPILLGKEKYGRNIAKIKFPEYFSLQLPPQFFVINVDKSKYLLMRMN